MTETTAQGPTEARSLDPHEMFTPEAATDPHPLFREMLEQCPVSRQEGGAFGDDPTVYLSNYDDVRWALRHPEIFSSTETVEIGNERPLIPLQVDPPEHAKYRRLLDPEFSPRWIAELEEGTRALVDELIDGFIEHGVCDFHADFSQPLPSTVFLEFFGLPLDRRDDFFRWRDNIIRPDAADLEAAQALRVATGQEMYAYLGQVMDERLEDPDDGLLSRLLHARIEGEKLSREEILDISYLLMIAGLDTVTATLDCSMTNLARHPALRQTLAEDPTRADDAVEELLRFESPVQVVPRIVRQEITMNGVDLQPGDRVTVVIGATNIDPDHFEHAEQVDFDRQANRHLAFGGGPHRCLGSHLARMELRVALEQWHRRIPDYALDVDVVPHFSPGIRQPPALPLRWPASS